MKYSLLENYRLEKRIAKLEGILLERTFGKAGEPSKAYQIWDYLMNNGPKTVSQLQQVFPKSISSITNIKFFAKNDLLVMDGNLVSANPEYSWDDVGVIPRTMQQELTNDLRNGKLPLAGEYNQEEEPAQTRTPRNSKVKPNLFSRKFDNVKAAVDAGQDVNQTDSAGRTPLVYACFDNKRSSGPIVEYLLEHGADANDEFVNKPVLLTAIRFHNTDAIKALVEHGANINIKHNGLKPIEYAYLKCDMFDDTLLLLASPDIVVNDIILSLSSLTVKGKITVDLYTKLVNTLVNKSSMDRILPNAVEREILSNMFVLLDRYMDLGVWRGVQVWLADTVTNSDIINKLYKRIKLVCAGGYDIDGVSTFFKVAHTICKKAGKPDDFIYDFITDDWIKNTRNIYNVTSVVIDAASRNDTSTLSKVVKSKRDDLAVNDLINAVVDSNLNIDNRSMNLLCRIIGNCLKDRKPLQTTLAKIGMKCSNKYLINFMIDSGYGPDILSSITGAREPSKLFKSIAEENGLDVNGYDINKYNKDTERQVEKRNLISYVEDDIFRFAEDVLKKYPELLNDKDVVKVIKDHKNNSSYTAVQLRRRLKDIHTDEPIYNF